MAHLERETDSGSGLRAIAFVVSREDEEVIEEAVRQAASGLEGSNRRGRALALIAKSYIER